MKKYRNYLRENGKSQNTIITYLSELKLFTKWAELENITPEQTTHNEMLTYVQYCQSRGNKQQSIQYKLCSLNHYFNYLIEKDILEVNPITKIDLQGTRPKQIHHLLTREELENLYTQYPPITVENKASSLRNKVIIGFLVWQGLTVGELKKLTTKHLNLREGTLRVSGSRKSNPRDLSLHPKQLYDLMDYIQNTLPKVSNIPSNREQLLLKSTNGKDIRGSLPTLLKHLQKLNSNIKSLHQIRANVIIHWLKTENLRLVQYKAGHKYVSSTEVYQRSDIEGLQQSLQKYHPSQNGFSNDN